MKVKQDSISSMLWRASRDPEIAIANPRTIEKMLQEGNKELVEVETPPVREGLQKLFNERLEKAFSIVEELPLCPYPDSNLVEFYDDIRFSIIFGMYGNAINLCGTLLEFSLKYVRFLKDCGREEPFNQKAWRDYIEQQPLHCAIQKARKENFIDEDIEKRLISFKDDIRNPYAHFNIQKIVEHVVFEKVRQLDLNTNQFIEKDMDAIESPIFQILAKRQIDEMRVFEVFKFVDKIVNHLLAVLFEKVSIDS